jgi:choline dehydrogenase-like flavoprotein
MPVGNIFLIPHARYNWKHTLSGNAQIGGRSINFPRGKLMGGCSAINGGVYIRGQREDYDAWARAGNAGWAYSDVLPAFTAVENYAGADKPWHGKGGELDVQKPRSFNPITHAIIAAAQQAGHQRNDDFAGERQAGFGPYDLNQRRGTRLSSARAFLNPVLKRPNLTVLSETLARRILFDRGGPPGSKSSRRASGACSGPARGGAVRRGDQLAAIADAVGHRPGGASAREGHRGALRSARRGRASAGPSHRPCRDGEPQRGILCALAAHLWPYPAQPFALSAAP